MFRSGWKLPFHLLLLMAMGEQAFLSSAEPKRDFLLLPNQVFHSNSDEGPALSFPEDRSSFLFDFERDHSFFPERFDLPYLGVENSRPSNLNRRDQLSGRVEPLLASEFDVFLDENLTPIQYEVVPPPPPLADDMGNTFVLTPIPEPTPGGSHLVVENWSPLVQRFFLTPDSSGEAGIGQERVQFAPFEMDVTQPSNYWLIRADAGYGLQHPDRASFFWSRSGSGQTQNSINYQDLRLINELGTDSFSVMTEIPVRAVDYLTTGGSDGGLGDMKVATKVRMINGKQWQISQIFRTYIPTGNMMRGTGTGHVSLEPGLLARYKVSPITYLHGQIKLWFPIGADPIVAGQVLTYGIGVSHVLYETDTFAVLPTLEMVNYQFMGSHQRVVDPLTNTVLVTSSRGDYATNLVMGTRFVLGPPGDLGLVELGVSGMFGMGSERYLDSMLRVDLKFNF